MKRWLPILIFAAGLAACTAVAVLTVSRGPFDRSPAGNEAVIWDAAQMAAQGKLDRAALVAYPSPLYPRVLALFTGDSLTAAQDARRALTLVLLPLAGALVYALARRRTGPWPAAVAAWLTVMAAPVVLSAGAFSPSLPAALLCGIALVILDGKRSLLAWALAGILVGLSGQLNGPLAWAMGALLAVMAVLRPREGAGRRDWALRLGAFALLWVAGSWGGNAVAGSRSPLPPLQGVDVYRGHRAAASGVEPRRGDTDAMRWWVGHDFVREGSRLSGRRLTPAEAGAFWARRAGGEVLRHPFSELKRTGVKILATYQGDPLPRDVSPEFLVKRGETGMLPASIWLGRIAFPLGLAGLMLSRRRSGWILWVAAGSGLLVALVTFAEVDARVLSVLGLGAGLALFLDQLETPRGAARLRPAIAGVAAIAIFGLWPAFGGVPGQRILADDYVQMGGIYDREQRGSAAMREYERALRMEPGNPIPRYGIAGMLVRDNVTEEAIRELESLREQNPDFLPGLAVLARLYEREERWAEASSVYGDLIRLDPFDPESLNNLGTMYVQVGFYDQAAQAFQSALAVDPEYEAAKENLAALQERGLAPGGAAAEADPLRAAQEQVLEFVRTGNVAAADSAVEAAYERFGRNLPDLVFVDGTVRLATGRPAEAVTLFESVKQAYGKHAIFLNNLAAAYAQSGRLAEAAATWEEALQVQPTNERMRRSLTLVRAEMDSLARARGR